MLSETTGAITQSEQMLYETTSAITQTEQMLSETTEQSHRLNRCYLKQQSNHTD